VNPPAHTAIPTLAGLQLTAEVHEIREMYLNLLSSSMYKQTASKVHPAFAEIIRQLTPDEARILHHFRNNWSLELWQADLEKKVEGNLQRRCVQKRMTTALPLLSLENSDNLGIYIDNLLRLGLLSEAKFGVHHIHSAVLSKFLDLTEECDVPAENHWFGVLVQEYETLRGLPKLLAGEDSLLFMWRTTAFLSKFGRSFCQCCVSDVVAARPQAEPDVELFLAQR